MCCWAITARDQDRFELLDPLLLDLLREAVRVGDSGGQMSAAAKAHQELVDAALETRAELARWKRSAPPCCGAWIAAAAYLPAWASARTPANCAPHWRTWSGA